MKLVESHIVPTGKEMIRLSDYVKNIFEVIPTRKGMKKAIDKGYVFVNGERATTGRYIQTGDMIELHLPESFKKAFEYPIRVIYEDDDIAVVVKPAGMLSNGNSFKTLENTLPYNLSASTVKDALFYPQVAHRLDYATTGLMLVAKTRSANKRLKEMFAERSIKKTYHAITVGKMNPDKGVVTSHVDGKEAKSLYEVVATTPSAKYVCFNLLKLTPETGRRHQLRVHLATMGHPILGDRDYGTAEHWDMKKGLYLVATVVRFCHPKSSEQLQFEIELPKKFYKLISRN